MEDMLHDFLFPASKLIFDTRSTPSKDTVIDVSPKYVGFVDFLTTWSKV